MRLDLALVYLIRQFFFRAALFFVHWYGHSFLIISSGAVGILKKLDMFFTVRRCLKDIFRRPPAGGCFFRAITGLLIYGIVAGLGLFAFVFWSLIHFYLVVRIFI